MNKKEFIETLIDMGGSDAKLGTWARGWDDAISEVLGIAEELDEPEVPVIPQFVADFIRATKPSNSLRLAFEYIAQRKIDNYDDKLALWIEEGNSELFASAWLVRYEVEKEPVYFAKIKGHELVETETILDEDTGDDISEFYRNVHFVLQRNGELVIDMKDSGLSGAKHTMTMKQWNDLGINETNADFEEVME